MTVSELERELQIRGENMHDAVYRVAHEEPDEDEPNLLQPEGIVCDGPCTTCIVREVAFAMWPVFKELARRDLMDEMADAA